jgi:hypothetical protein
MLTQWKAQLDPVLAEPFTGGSFLQNVPLISGSTVINHGLGVTPQGWLLADNTAPVTIYRSSPFNDKTLTLTASGATTISLFIF